MSVKTLYRISFTNQDSTYVIYARKICESEIFGFLEVEEFVFGENTSLVVDPSEERLKLEFNEVKKTYIPLHTIIRMDELTKQGIAKMREKENKANIFHMPSKLKD